MYRRRKLRQELRKKNRIRKKQIKSALVFMGADFVYMMPFG